MPQTVEELEKLINEVAQKIGERDFGLSPGMFRIYLDPDIGVDYRAIRGPTVQLYLSATPFDKNFKIVLRDALGEVKRLHSPLALVPGSYYRDVKKSLRKLFKDDDYEPPYRIDIGRVRFKTTFVIKVEAVDVVTKVKVTIIGNNNETEWALKERAHNELSHMANRVYNDLDSDASD